MIDIKLNAHSSIRVRGQNRVVYFDPYKISEEIHDADYIFFTHSHYDHFSPEDVKKVSKPSTVYVAPSDMKSDLLGLSIKEENINLLWAYDVMVMGIIKAEAIPSYNVKKGYHPKEKGWLGYVLTIDNKRVYVSGDTDLTEDAKKVKCDIALIPIGGTYTMDYKDAGRLINYIKPKVAIPTHYGSIVGSRQDAFNFRDFVEKDVEVKIMM